MADTHVTITGNLTDDPELKFTPQGTAVANFRIAVTTRVRDGRATSPMHPTPLRRASSRALRRSYSSLCSRLRR